MLEHRPHPAYLFLLVLAMACWACSNPWRLWMLLPVLLLVGLAYGTRWVWRAQSIHWFLLSGGLVAFHYFVLLADFSGGQVSIYDLRLIEALGSSLIWLIGLQWLSWRSRDFDWLLFSMGILVMLSGIFEQAFAQRLVFIWLTLSFVGSLLTLRLFPRFRTHHSQLPLPARHLLRFYLQICLLGFVFIGSGAFTIQLSEIVDQRFDEMLTRFVMQTSSSWSGFSGYTVLRGGQEIQLSDQVALLIEGPAPPDYWRGNVLTHYQQGRWTPDESVFLPEATHPEPALEAYPPHPLGLVKQHYRVEPQQAFNGVIFSPFQTVQTQLGKGAEVYQSHYGLLRREQQQTQPYQLLMGETLQNSATYDQRMLEENLALEPELRQALRKLALEITAGAQTPEAKALKINRWFQENFTYSLKMPPLPTHQDPVLYFLEHRQPAWCSWFASGMVLMLRSLDIPAHVVSGWRSSDWNPLVRKWVIREKEAHDWVEVLDQERHQWLTFDPTPADQLAQITGSGAKLGLAQQLIESLGLWLGRLSQQLGQLNLREAVQLFKQLVLYLLVQPLFYLLMLLLVLLNFWLKRSRRKGAESELASLLHYGPRDPLYLQAILQLQQWAEAQGLPPPTAQGLEAWAESLELAGAERAWLLQVLQQINQLGYGEASEALRQQVQRVLESLQTKQVQQADTRYNRQ